MRKKLVIHAHSDPKFIYQMNIFSKEHFENVLVYIGEENKLEQEFREIAILLPRTEKESLIKLRSLCENVDLVVISYLSPFAIDLVLSLPKNIRIIWRFFGGEIYTKEPNLIYSEKSLKFQNSSYKKMSITNKLKHHMWNLLHPKDKFRLALKRINYFMGLMDDEYALIKSLGYNLPPFIQVPFSNFPPDKKIYDKSELIIFGNSRSKGNNHLDILELLKKNQLSTTLKIKMFFNYGPQGDYSLEVAEQSKQIKQIELVENFMPFADFNRIYQKASALIFNGYRQMAIGNIYIAIRNGVKVYLSERNVTYNWLLKNNVRVFSIEKELQQDLITKKYFLTKEENENNIKNLTILKSNYSNQKFNEKLLEILQ